jgi:crotonobetainyl-CoA:carnitine CoA-transferase CaiB-like acyl-CoA transferase
VFADRVARTSEINATIATAVARFDRADVLERFAAEGAPASPVLAPEDVADHPQIRARAFHVDTAIGRVAALPARLGNGGRTAPTTIPALGEHEGFTH